MRLEARLAGVSGRPRLRPELGEIMFAISLLLQESGLTLRKVLTDIPHDLPALVVYLLLGGFVFLIWRGSRRSPPTA